MKNQHVLERPKTRAKVIGWLVEGKGPSEIARLTNTTPQAVCGFKKRHAAELAPVIEQVERAITDYAIAHKVNRIAGLNALAEQVQAYIDDRGLIERSEITTEKATITRERFAREVPAELRAIYHAAAEETGQLPKPADATVNVNVGVAVNLTWGDGEQA